MKKHAIKGHGGRSLIVELPDQFPDMGYWTKITLREGGSYLIEPYPGMKLLVMLESDGTTTTLGYNTAKPLSEIMEHYQWT